MGRLKARESEVKVPKQNGVSKDEKRGDSAYEGWRGLRLSSKSE